MTAWHSGNNALGLVGGGLLGLFWLAMLTPMPVDDLLRPYGLFVLFGLLIAAVALPTVAAIRGSRWWSLVAAAAAVSVAHFFMGVMS